MKKLTIIIFLTFFLFSPLLFSQSYCDESTAEKVGYVYYFANPTFMINDYNALSNLIESDDDLLSSDSRVIRCMRIAGLRMKNYNLQNLDSDAGDEAWDRAVEMGASDETADQIQTNIDNSQIQLYALGQELVWLSEVLPECAAGDCTSFHTTSPLLRQQSIDYIRTIVPMIVVMGDQWVLNLLLANLNYYGPYTVYQTAYLVEAITK